MTEYTKTPEEWEKELIMTVEEFKSAVKSGMFIDYDGFAHPAKDGLMSKDYIYPSQIESLPPDATHVYWYNR